ncbi:hypothetical protein BU16DRAFT_545629, partial [Lophium mytilinum]
KIKSIFKEIVLSFIVKGLNIKKLGLYFFKSPPSSIRLAKKRPHYIKEEKEKKKKELVETVKVEKERKKKEIKKKEIKKKEIKKKEIKERELVDIVIVEKAKK